MNPYDFYRGSRSTPTTSMLQAFSRNGNGDGGAGGGYGQSDLDKILQPYGGGSAGTTTTNNNGGNNNNNNNSLRDEKPFRGLEDDFMDHDHRDGESSGSRRGRDGSVGGSGGGRRGSVSGSMAASSGPTAKRGSKACTACRRGKNRCEPDPTGRSSSCRRCLVNKVPCVFEKASEKTGPRRSGTTTTEGLSISAEGRVSHLEDSVRNLAQGQSQIQSALQQILSMLPGSSSLSTTPTSVAFLPQSSASDTATGVPPSNIFPSVSPPGMFSSKAYSPTTNVHSGHGGNANDVGGMMDQFTHSHSHSQRRPTSPQNTATGRTGGPAVDKERRDKKEFPKLPGFAPPDHIFGTYGIIPISSAPASPTHSHRSARSPSAESNVSALPQDSLTAPIQALQTLANAADQAASSRSKNEPGETDRPKTGEADRDVDGDGGGGAEAQVMWGKRKRVRIEGKDPVLRVRKKTKPDPTPRNPFPDVVTKGLVSEAEARELWDIFFSGCHYFVPLWDKKYDTYETYIERTPFSTNGLLAVAAKIRAGNGPLGQTFQRCLEEAQGIARSTLFGPIVRKEAVGAMLILSVWSQNGWMPCGHALRGGLDMNLHRALDKLAADPTESRSEAEERDLVVSARIWLNCYMHHHLVSLGTGKPLLLNDESFVRHARLLLDHPMGSETDMRLIAGVELVSLRVRVFEHLRPLHGKVDFQTLSFVKRMFADLQSWYNEWYEIHRQKLDEESVMVKLLEAELVYAQMWTVCVALRGCQWDKLPSDQRELAFKAKDAAVRLMEIFLRSPNFRAHLKYATHDQLVSVAFAAVFLLKIAILYPSAVPLPDLISQVSELAHLLSAECYAERYALTLRLMLANFRRKTGALSTLPGTPRGSGSTDPSQLQTLLNSANAAAAANANSSSNANNSDGANGAMNGMAMDDGLQSLLSLPQMGGGEYTDGSGGGIGEWNFDGLDGFLAPDEFSPSNLPVWLQDGNFTDLGLPQDGSDSLFLPPELASMFLPSNSSLNLNNQFALPDSADVGAEAW